jgi:hypothetical protein
MCFKVVTGENWNDVLISGVKSVGFWSAIYFVSLFVIGNYMVLSLFLAILLGNFEDDQDSQGNEVEDRPVLVRKVFVWLCLDKFPRICCPFRGFSSKTE